MNSSAYGYALIAWLLLSSSQATGADFSLGRLFFTPREREEMNQMRRQLIQNPPTAHTETEPPPLPAHLTLNGIVVRSQGKNVIWLNQQQNLQETDLPGLRIEAAAIHGVGLPIHLINGDRPLVLKPGQRLDTSTGEIQESYQQTP